MLLSRRFIAVGLIRTSQAAARSPLHPACIVEHFVGRLLVVRDLFELGVDHVVLAAAGALDGPAASRLGRSWALYIASPSFIEACARRLGLGLDRLGVLALQRAPSGRRSPPRSRSSRPAPTLSPCSAAPSRSSGSGASAWFLASTSSPCCLSSAACASASLTMRSMSASRQAAGGLDADRLLLAGAPCPWPRR